MVMILQLRRAWDRKFTAAAQTLNLIELNQQSDYGEFCHKKKKQTIMHILTNEVHELLLLSGLMLTSFQI